MQATVYRKGYFMTDKDEKAANWDMLVELKQQRSRLSSLCKQAEGIGTELECFGRVLANPSWDFQVHEKSIHGNGMIPNTGEASILLENLDANRIAALINDINETKSNIKRLGDHVRELDI